uniref:DRBM domain-containing protein n=1 Tax=Hucho hucho TaxID=62062 RepID=A0A4W5RXM8_9TELE
MAFAFLYKYGSGTSKKPAKPNAAAKMLSRIHDVPVDLSSSHEMEAEDDTFTIVRHGLCSLWHKIAHDQQGEAGKCKGLGCTWDSEELSRRDDTAAEEPLSQLSQLSRPSSKELAC